MIRTIWWTNGRVEMIDQTKLPHKEEVLVCEDYLEIAAAIKSMQIRGAPAIGVAAAFGMALGAKQSKARTTEELLKDLEQAYNTLIETRPTAINLKWALDRMKEKAQLLSSSDVPSVKAALEKEADLIWREDIETNRKIGENGAPLLNSGDTILTHCNAGALATSEYGTALGVIRKAVEDGKKIEVYVDETRPLLQGARLTAWELQKEKIPHILITDNMAGYFMSRGKIDGVIVGADRIASNGDVANKIGTYSLAVLAKENHIPFYVAAPVSTIDFGIRTGEEIPIEEREAAEITCVQGVGCAPAGVKVANPAFDVTPNKYITAIITEKGVAGPPYDESLRKHRR